MSRDRSKVSQIGKSSLDFRGFVLRVAGGERRAWCAVAVTSDASEFVLGLVASPCRVAGTGLEGRRGEGGLEQFSKYAAVHVAGNGNPQQMQHRGGNV